jgi:hypothetical protein
MKASEIFHKTAKGQSEVETRANALSVKERRVLILVNGENNAAKLKQLSLCENIVEILDTLLSGGFISQDTATSPRAEFEAEADSASGTDITDTTETTPHEVSARRRGYRRSQGKNQTLVSRNLGNAWRNVPGGRPAQRSPGNDSRRRNQRPALIPFEPAVNLLSRIDRLQFIELVTAQGIGLPKSSNKIARVRMHLE